MGEVELVEAGSVEPFPANHQSNEQHDLTEFLSTNRTGRRNALAHLGGHELDDPMAGCSSQAMTMKFGHHEDLSVAGLAQKLQQMDAGSFSDQPSTSGHCSGFGGRYCTAGVTLRSQGEADALWPCMADV